MPDPPSVDRIADVLNADVAMVMQLAGHLPAVEAIDPDSAAERVAAKLRRLERHRPLWVAAIEAQADWFLGELRREQAEERAAKKGEGGQS